MSKVTARQLQCARLFCALGYMPSGASSIVGNLTWEAGGNGSLPTRFRKSNLDHGSNGMPQWRLGRLIGYQNYVKQFHPNASQDELWDHYGRMDYQVAYIDIELKRDYPPLHAKLRDGGPVAALTADFTWTYERPSRKYAHLNERITYAQAIYAALNPASGPVAVANAIDMDAAKHDQASAGGAIIASVGLVGGGATVVQHIAPHLHTGEIVGLAAAAVLVIGGGIASMFYAANARRVRSAKVGIDPGLPPQIIVDPPKPAPAVPDPQQQPTYPAVQKRTAAQEEHDAIQRIIAAGPQQGATPVVEPAPLETAQPAPTYELK